MYPSTYLYLTHKSKYAGIFYVIHLTPTAWPTSTLPVPAQPWQTLPMSQTVTTIITTGHYFDLRTRSLIWLSRAILSLPWNCGKMEWKRVVYLVKYSHPLHFFNNFMAVVTSFCPTLCWLSKLEIVWSKPVWTVVTVEIKKQNLVYNSN